MQRLAVGLVLEDEGERQEDHAGHGGHVAQQVDGVHLLVCVAEEEGLHDGLEGAGAGATEAREEADEVEGGLEAARYDDAYDHGDERQVGVSRLHDPHDEERQHRCEDRRRGADRLVERDGKEPQRHVAEDHGPHKHDGQERDLRHVRAGLDLARLYESQDHGNLAEDHAGDHVAEREEDWVLEVVEAQHVFIQENHPDVAGVPPCHHEGCDHVPGAGHPTDLFEIFASGLVLCRCCS